MGTLRIQGEVRWPGGWATWVSATTAVLEALGVVTDRIDVAGATGHAFALAVHVNLAAVGPASIERGGLESALPALGRTCLSFRAGEPHTKDRRTEATRAHCREAHDLATRELEAGRPCVLYGAYGPEHAVVVGVDAERYHVVSSRRARNEAEPPIRYDEIDAPLGPYLLAMPTATTAVSSPAAADHRAIGRAVARLGAVSPRPDVVEGLAAYDAWSTALRAGRVESAGSALHAQVWAEMRSMARTWLERLVARHGRVAPPLARAADAYAEASAALKRVASLFPYPARNESEEPARRAAAAALLEQAKAAELRALGSLEAALAASW